MLLSTMYQMPKFHVLKATILQATDKRPISVKIESVMWAQTVTIPCKNSPGSDIPKVETVINWCEENGFEVVGWENGEHHAFIVTNTNKPIKAR